MPPVAGQEIVIPTVIAHIAGEAESTTTLARRYYADPNRSWELDQYNARKPGLLRRGEVMLVPLPSLALTEQGKLEARHAVEGAVTEGTGSAHEAQKHAEAEIPLLLGHFSDGTHGDYASIAHKDIDTAELLRRLSRHPFAIGKAGHVGKNGRGFHIATP